MNKKKKKEILNFLKEYYGEGLDYELSFHSGYVEETIIGAGFVCREEAREITTEIRKELSMNGLIGSIAKVAKGLEEIER